MTKYFLGFVFALFSLSAVAKPAITQIAAVNLTTAGTAQKVSATSVKCTCAVINALAANTGVIYLGDSAVAAANGLVLQKGDSATMCAIRPQAYVDLSELYFDGGTTNDDIKVSCLTEMDIKIVPKPL